MVRTRYGYAESSNIKATLAGHIFDVVQDGAALENGMLKKLGDEKAGQGLEVREVKKAVTKDKVVLILSALYGTDGTIAGNHEMYLRKEAGEVARAYEIVEEDRFAIGEYMITALAGGKVVEGNLVVLDEAKGLYKEVAKASEAATRGTNGFVAKIVKVENKGAFNLVRLRVIQNTQIA